MNAKVAETAETPKRRWTDKLHDKAHKVHNKSAFIGAILCWLTKRRRIGGRIDAWAAVALLILGFIIFKLLPYFSPTAGADIAGSTAAIFPILAAAALVGVVCFIIIKANFWAPTWEDEVGLLKAATKSWRDFGVYVVAIWTDRVSFMLLFFWIFQAAVGK